LLQAKRAKLNAEKLLKVSVQGGGEIRAAREAIPFSNKASLLSLTSGETRKPAVPITNRQCAGSP